MTRAPSSCQWALYCECVHKEKLGEISEKFGLYRNFKRSVTLTNLRVYEQFNSRTYGYLFKLLTCRLSPCTTTKEEQKQRWKPDWRTARPPELLLPSDSSALTSKSKIAEHEFNIQSVLLVCGKVRPFMVKFVWLTTS